MRTWALVGLFVVVLAGCDRRPEVEGEGVLAIVGATLIDGTGAPPQDDVAVVVVDGRIDRVVDAASVRFASNVEVIQAEGQWLLPGFIDAHAHLPARDRLPEFFGQLLEAGITAARCPATTTEYGVEIRERLDAGDFVGPTFRVAGGLIDGEGAWFDYAVVVESEAEIRAEVAAQAAVGVDFVKFYTRLPPNLLAAGVEEAHAHGLQAIGHLGMTSWSEAAEAGIDAITHSGFLGMVPDLVSEDRRSAYAGFYQPNRVDFNPTLFSALASDLAAGDEATRQLATRLVEAGVIVDPTLVVLEAMIRGDDQRLFERLVPPEFRGDFEAHPASAWWYPEWRDGALRALPHFFRAVRILHEEGVLLTAGTDISTPWMIPGVSFHRELELLVEAGITNGDVIVIATRNGARSMGMADEIGTVEAGKRADLVLLSADPLEDIRHTERIEAVFKDGNRIR